MGFISDMMVALKPPSNIFRIMEYIVREPILRCRNIYQNKWVLTEHQSILWLFGTPFVGKILKPFVVRAVIKITPQEVMAPLIEAINNCQTLLILYGPFLFSRWQFSTGKLHRQVLSIIYLTESSSNRDWQWIWKNMLYVDWYSLW